VKRPDFFPLPFPLLSFNILLICFRVTGEEVLAGFINLSGGRSVDFVLIDQVFLSGLSKYNFHRLILEY